jgi:tRNA(Ile)-lysidine synthase
VTDLLQRVEQNIQYRRLLKPGQAVLVAVSGGLDSMTLLHVLHKLSSRHRWRLTVAHFNHRLRGRSSDADEKLVRQTAAAMKLPFVAGQANVREFAQKSKLSVEMAARKLRHDFFARAAMERKIRVIALAHHADDQVELFFLRVLRGAGGEGLAGMKWRSPSPVDSKIMLVRPLLDATKAELRGFAHEGKILFREDATNTSLDLPRNRVRNELLPLLQRRYQPALTKTVLRLMEIVGAEADLAGEAARQWLVSKRKIEHAPRPVPLPARRGEGGHRQAGPGEGIVFKDLPVAVQRRALQLQLAELGVSVDFDLVEQLRKSANRFVSVNSTLSVLRDAAGGVKLRTWLPAEFNASKLAVDLAGRAGEVTFDGVRVCWWFDAAKKFKRPAARPAGESFDADKVGGRITLRHWRPGDRFQPIGLKSPVKLQDLFTNRKIPRARRRELMVAAAENDEVFWVEGLRISENFKLTPQTKRRLVWRWQRPRIAPVFLPLLPKGGEGVKPRGGHAPLRGWGEEPVVSKIKSPHPGPLPARAGRGSRSSVKMRPLRLKTV